MNEEIKRILNMVEEGKLSAEDAAKLITALKTADSSQRKSRGGNGVMIGKTCFCGANYEEDDDPTDFTCCSDKEYVY